MLESSRSRLRALREDRSKLLNPSRNKDPQLNKNQDNVLPLVLTFHPSNKTVKEIIMNWGMLQFSELCKEALPAKPLFGTHKNNNLRDELIKSMLAPFYNLSVTGIFDRNN